MKYKRYLDRNTKIKVERKRIFLDKETENFDDIWPKPRTQLIPGYAVMFKLPSSFCIWTKNVSVLKVGLSPSKKILFYLLN